MDSDTRDTVGPNDLTLVLKLLDNMQSTMETGFEAVNTRLDKLNGRVATSESSIATLDERTSKMVCLTHASLLGQLETDVKALKDAPVKSHAKTSALTGASVAVVLALADGIWMWLSKR